MGDDVAALDLRDQEIAEYYHSMVQFLLDDAKDAKIKEHKYRLRASAGGRVRGLYLDIYNAVSQYQDRKLDPGLLTQHVEQSRAKIAAMKSNANSKYTTLLNLTDDGFADSLSSGTLEFTEDDLLTMSKRCIDFWKSNPDLYRKVANQVAHQAPGLRSSELNEIFFSTMSQEEVINRAKMVARAAQHGIHATYQQHDSEEEEEPEDEEMTQAQQEERVQSLKSLFTTLSDAELRKALIQTHGNVDAAADLLLNFN